MRLSLLTLIVFLSASFVVSQDAANVDDLSARDILDFETTNNLLERDPDALDVMTEHTRRTLQDAYKRTVDHAAFLARSIDDFEAQLERRYRPVVVDPCAAQCRSTEKLYQQRECSSCRFNNAR